MTDVLIRREKSGLRNREDHVKTDGEIGVVHWQGSECQQPPETIRVK